MNSDSDPASAKDSRTVKWGWIPVIRKPC